MSASIDFDITTCVGAPGGAFLSSGSFTWKANGTGSSTYKQSVRIDGINQAFER